MIIWPGAEVTIDAESPAAHGFLETAIRLGVSGEAMGARRSLPSRLKLKAAAPAAMATTSKSVAHRPNRGT